MTSFRLLEFSARRKKVDNSELKSLDVSMKKGASSGLIIQNYCLHVAATGELPLTKDQERQIHFNQYLRTAKQNCVHYQTILLPKINGTLSGAMETSNRVNAFFSRARQDFQRWKNGDVSAKDQLIRKIQVVGRKMSEQRDSANVLHKDLVSYLQLVNTDAGNFQKAFNTAKTVIGGAQGDIARLQQQIDDLDRKIKGTTAGVVVAGLLTIGGGLLFIVGAATSWMGGAGIPLMVAGGGLFAAGAIGTGTAAFFLSKYIGAKTDLMVQMAQLKQVIKDISLVSSTASSLQVEASRAADAVKNLGNAWSTLASRTDQFVSTIHDASKPEELGDLDAWLDVMIDDFEDVKSVASEIQNKMSNTQTKNVGKLTTENIRKAVAA